MKSIKDWLGELDEPYRTEALKLMKIGCQNQQVASQSVALVRAIDFADTGEPQKWYDLFERLVEKEERSPNI